ncbi:dedicator of cytokinesis protein 3 isoform X1 [Falco biarmicus]|uniref:dedicator of cytokinesis protein 3 isoform X1 n=1 Tax=Falco rusticolus TaxID=120794 RepID=UPI0018869162|nr:dedicator of cytokinesis protein 3 isoform X1 [Falco rusticolus]XP_055565425.1 dedicator of cytokinesis protein 3 isoform X1 [Falco cherrug]XP_055662314.1 dedicator of cytokinesis protein 3 isoform X1 [Falco peregrinus]XP_056193621.1 dedicator of cytokinesis protein 3 isoform X1 [Falco biarmicus]
MWSPTEEEKYGVVICSFRGAVPQGLVLELGETVQILEKCEGWYRGVSIKKPNVKGIFPANYIHLKKAIVSNRGQYETVVPLEDSVVTEVTATLQEWAVLWKQLYVKHKVDLFYKLRHVMNELIDLRRQLLSGHLTQDQVREVKRHLTVRLDWGNEHLGLDLVPRKDFEVVDSDQISVSDLYKMHLSSRHSVQQSTSQVDTIRQRHGEACRMPVPHHFFLSLKSFTYNTIGEDTDVFFSLYDVREGKQISERFMVRLNKNGGPRNPEKIDRMCALFTDLSSKDMKRDLYIVAHVIRIGRMLLNDSKKGPPHLHYRRPYGCAVLSIMDVLQSISEIKEEKDFVLKVYTCNNENEWCQIHENIIRKSSTKYTAPSSNYGLIISLQLLRGDMEQIRRENPMIFNRGVSVTRKLGFPDVIMPGDIRNDLYLTLEKGDFERGGKSVQKNIEVTMYVLYADGEILKDCISLGSGEPSRSAYHSFVLYHNNSPRWGEIIKLPIPIDRFRGSHLRFEFRHCSTKDKGEKKLFGFAFTPLMRDDGTTLSDDIHELYVYKCDENSTFNNHALYLGLPCCKEDYNGCPNIPSSLIFQRSTKETFSVSTQLSSTKLTQNVDLLALLKWKAYPDRVMDILGRLRHVSGEEIVKFLQDILDTLFVVLDDNTEKYGLLVFQSLVFIINLLRDSKYFHFRPVMDTYIQKHFAGALAYKELIRCLKWYMDRSAELVRQDHIQEAMRALEYLFKFIVQSRILYSRATCGMEEEQFRSSIQELFQSIRFVLSLDSRSSETLIFTQAPQPGGQASGAGTCAPQKCGGTSRPSFNAAALLNSFPAIFDELLQMFTVQEVAEFVRGTLGSMPSTVHIGQSMDVVKLQSIARTVDSRLFSFSESRRILLPVVLHHIHLHLRQQKELLICSGILSSIFSIIKASSLEGDVVEEVEMMVESLLDVLLQTLLTIMSKSQSQEAVRGQRCPQCTAEITGEYVSCLLSLLRQMSDTHFQHLLDNFQSKDELKEFLLKIFCVFRNLMKMSVFPRDWMVMRLLTSNIIVTTVQYLSSALHKNFTETDFDFKVWNSYFSLAVLFINQPSLQLENATPAKRKKILDKYGDMRVMMAYELFSMWQNLGEHKIHFIPGMIGPFLGVTLVPQPEVRNIMIPIFHDMMDWEQRKNGNFKQVEAELIDKLDSLVSEGKGDENYRELFSLLTQLFGPYPSLLEKIEQETWRETGISFVTSVTRLMERLLDYRDCMKGDETENKKIGCTVNLMNFYKSEINKEEMYIRYIHKLCDMHLQAENYTEAAFTLLLYCELLQWEDRPLREFLHYPSQSEWQRKEGLCRKIIHYFNKGKSWEFGIPLCRELAIQYESLYDYQSLSWIRKMEATYYDNIMEQQRLEPEFFRVGFYGRKFPFFLRNKEYVCRGHDYERLEAFQQRMLSEFPQAIAMQHPNHPDDSILQCDAQYLQIYAVTPIPDNIDVLQMDRVPDRIKSFYRVNNIRKFRYDRPFHKGPKDKENEFKSLWIERTTLTLTHSLPGISRWFEVERRELVEVSPLENAIQVVENKNQELRTLISQYQHKQMHGNINLLSMCLNGVIDAAVNGGIARYQEAFFDKDYITKHPGDAEKITQLKELMQEQVHVLGVGLAVHEKFVHPEMRPLHKKLIDQFQMMRSSLYHELPGLDKLSPACSGTSTPRSNVLVSHGPMSPESIKLVHRHSPLNLLGSVRHSSSSLSSHTSSETGNLVILTDSSVGETPEDMYHMQASPSTSSLSSTHSAPSQMINSAPSSARVLVKGAGLTTLEAEALYLSTEQIQHGRQPCKLPHAAPTNVPHLCPGGTTSRGSPSLPDKYRHSREMMMLLPAHRDRPSSAMYPTAIMENGQPPNFQRALIQQMIGPCKPCSDPNLSVAEKAVPAAPSSWSLDSGTREALPFLSAHAGSILAPPVPPRSLPHGHYSLHFDAFHHQLSDAPPALPARTLRKSPLHPIPASPTSPQSGLDGSNSTLSGSASSGVSSLSESNFGHSSEPPPRTDTMDSVPSQAWNTDEDLETPYLPVRYSLSEPDVLESLKSQPCRSHSAPSGVIPQDTMDPPALPPKPYHSRLPNMENEEGMIIEDDDKHRPLHRKVSQPASGGKEEQARVAWEHGISEQ